MFKVFLSLLFSFTFFTNTAQAESKVNECDLMVSISLSFYFHHNESELIDHRYSESKRVSTLNNVVIYEVESITSPNEEAHSWVAVAKKVIDAKTGDLITCNLEHITKNTAEER